ncbi:MAG TPA: YifB family Mg chelatase-like AAA ATPase [Actinomycetota bacterium]|nr:YifB family Mg chelatase-like AAA ATPase [Actinomycetota bacterium]
MFAKVSSVALVGLEARAVEVEVQIESGLPDVRIIGLPSVGVRESRQRVRAAVKNAGYTWPEARITANLAPGDLRKDGSLLDLPLAVAVLTAWGEVGGLTQQAVARHVFVGELALDGTLRPIRGAVAAALTARDRGAQSLVVPAGNSNEAALVPGARVFGVATLREAVEVARGCRLAVASRPALEDFLAKGAAAQPDLAEVRGQALARRALEIAAAGGHNLLMVGPPGSGKTMLARRLPGILPPLSVDEALEVTHVWSVAGLLTEQQPVVAARPFRAPHHHASAAAVIGGGSPVARPGEVSLAHRGVLFLDEAPLFGSTVLDALRQPLEDGTVSIARRAGTVRFPSHCALVAAANPCLCRPESHKGGTCTCSTGRLEAYRSRLSGPLLDRIDLQVEAAALSEEELLDLEPSEPSASVRARVLAARAAQLRRAKALNQSLPDGDLEDACALDAGTTAFLRRAMATQPTSARAHHRLLRVARTIADLDGVAEVGERQVAEALQFRRSVWEPDPWTL